MDSRRRSTWTFLAAAVPPLVVYVATLEPSIPAGDSGELITAAATLGVAHPPGYPLYVWLGHAWTLLVPLGSVAWRLNLLSAICGAAAAGFIALAVLRLTRSPLAAVAAAWTLAVSAPQWKYSIVAEVFAPNALLAAIVLYAFALLLEPAAPDEGAAPAARGGAVSGGGATSRAPWLVLGLASSLLLSHHHTLVLLVVPVVVTALVTPRLRPRTRVALAALVAAVVGLVPLIQLPLAAHAPNALVWGDASTWRGFLRQLLRADYGTFSLAPRGAALAHGIGHGFLYLDSLPAAVGWPALALAALGLGVTALRRPPLAAAVVGFAVMQCAFFARAGLPTDMAVMRGVVERFYLLPNVVLALLVGLGFGVVAARVSRAWLLPLLAAAIVATPAVATARTLAPRGARFTENLGRSILASLPPNAVLFLRGDLYHNALSVLTRVQGVRPDVAIVDQELLNYDWYVRQVRAADSTLLPSLGRAQRITLRDGRVVEGLVVRHDSSHVDLLLERANTVVPASDVAWVEPIAEPVRAFVATRAAWHASPLVPESEDRYSLLPGTRNLLWLDHLAGRRPVALLGFKDESFALRYDLVPRGMVLMAWPRGRTPTPRVQALKMLEVAPAIALDDYFQHWPATSFERAERTHYADFVAYALPLLVNPAAESLATRPDLAAGRAALLRFAARFETLEPTPDPDCLRAVAFLRVFDAGFRDLGRARRDFDRYLATKPEGPDADTARALRARLGS